MRVLFYLPVITPRWFQRLFVPLIRAMASECEVHILAPALWQGTGLGESELALCKDLPPIGFHIVDDPTHPTLRLSPANPEAIVDFVHALAPDYTVCRSADFETIKAFPGVVRQITEGAADPLIYPRDSFHLTFSPFDHGFMPNLAPETTARLDAMIKAHPEMFGNALTDSPGGDANAQAIRDWAGFRDDRLSLFLPLEYEHEENFFAAH
ncbi:MAG: hypothetical protein HRT64_14200, partial [Erythrobacter sp.]|nr:hypothetical protein [Erythrobacter sp.]